MHFIVAPVAPLVSVAVVSEVLGTKKTKQSRFWHRVERDELGKSQLPSNWKRISEQHGNTHERVREGGQANCITAELVSGNKQICENLNSHCNKKRHES